MDLDELKALLYVAESGSFVAAAAKLNWPRSSLRRKVESLESRAGLALLVRTRGGVVVTDAGKMLVARGRVMMEESRALLASIRDGAGEATGTLRVAIPVGMPPQLAPPLWEMIRAAHPSLHFEVSVVANPIADRLSEFDVVMHFSLGDPVGPYITQRLMTVRQRLLASEEYLSRHGEPRALSDLANAHQLLSWIAPGEEGSELHGPSGARPIAALIRSTDIHMLRVCAAAGQGIAYIPDAEGVQSEASPLVCVLGDEVFRELGLYLTVPAALAEIPKVKSVLRQFFGFVDGIRT
jgi:DNA-binding transcriptional LysR family regulator